MYAIIIGGESGSNAPIIEPSDSSTSCASRSSAAERIAS